MPRTTTKVLASVAVAALAAAGVAAVVNYRLGQRPDPEECAHLGELDARLKLAEEPETGTPPGRIGRILDGLQRSQDISVRRLRNWITAVRQRNLTPDRAAAVAEGDFGALERPADQGGV
jgi:hypothetical protein